MKTKIWNVLLIALALFGTFLLGYGIRDVHVQTATAQSIATNYAWADSITVGTSSTDSLFTNRWEQVSLKFEGTANGYVRFGAPDTTNWSSRDWYQLTAGEVLTFGPATKLVRAEFKTSTGTMTVYMAGYKRVPQW